MKILLEISIPTGNLAALPNSGSFYRRQFFYCCFCGWGMAQGFMVVSLMLIKPHILVAPISVLTYLFEMPTRLQLKSVVSTTWTMAIARLPA